MGRPRKIINPGDTFGFLTVLGEGGLDSFGHRMIDVRCSCGKEFKVQTGFLSKENPKCLECGIKYHPAREAEDITGQTINNWTAIEKAGGRRTGTQILYKCKCNNCGTITLKSKSQLERNKTGKCASCSPNYKFTVVGDTAIGILPDGNTHFIIDKADIPLVNSRWWHMTRDGYIESAGSKRMPKVKLHQFLMGEVPDGYVVDHINRNVLDCRRCNLRTATLQQNSMNRSMGRNNTSGYVGVSYVTSRKHYRAQIGINNRTIRLGISNDPVVCAQLYNIAADFLFGEYRGHVNDVPKPEGWMRLNVVKRLKPYMKESEVARRNPGYFISEEAV